MKSLSACSYLNFKQNKNKIGKQFVPESHVGLQGKKVEQKEIKR